MRRIKHQLIIELVSEDKFEQQEAIAKALIKLVTGQDYIEEDAKEEHVAFMAKLQEGDMKSTEVLNFLDQEIRTAA